MRRLRTQRALGFGAWFMTCLVFALPAMGQGDGDLCTWGLRESVSASPLTFCGVEVSPAFGSGASIAITPEGTDHSFNICTELGRTPQGAVSLSATCSNATGESEAATAVATFPVLRPEPPILLP